MSGNVSELDSSVSASSASAPSARVAEAAASALPAAAADSPMAAAAASTASAGGPTRPALVVSREDSEDRVGGNGISQKDSVRSAEEPNPRLAQDFQVALDNSVAAPPEAPGLRPLRRHGTKWLARRPPGQQPLGRSSSEHRKAILSAEKLR